MSTMQEECEELEPLFDYSRVQPSQFISLDEDDSPPNSPKRVKISEPLLNASVKENEKAEKIVTCDDDEDDEAWLLPPPNLLAKNVRGLDEDPTLKQLRLKKLELLAFAQSDNLGAVDDFSKKEVHDSLQCSSEKAASEDAKPSERAKIVISIQDKEGLKQFRVYMDDKFERLFKMYADRVKLDLERLAFSFDGDKIIPTTTPLGLGMEDDDIIEVHIKPT